MAKENVMAKSKIYQVKESGPERSPTYHVRIFDPTTKGGLESGFQTSFPMHVVILERILKQAGYKAVKRWPTRSIMNTILDSSKGRG